MFGFFFGTACLIGFAYMFRRGRHHGPHWGARRYGMRRLFSRLRTTPEQEATLSGVIDDLFDRAAELRRDADRARADAAAALRSDAFDRSAFEAALSEVVTSLEQFKLDVVDAFGRVYEALDERQRSTLASVLEKGHRGHWRDHGPYRTAL